TWKTGNASRIATRANVLHFSPLQSCTAIFCEIVHARSMPVEEMKSNRDSGREQFWRGASVQTVAASRESAAFFTRSQRRSHETPLQGEETPHLRSRLAAAAFLGVARNFSGTFLELVHLIH